MKDHEIALLVNELTKIAKQSHDHQSLRERISHVVNDALTPPKEVPKCCVCGTTENLHKDGWYGYRCDSTDCVCY